MNTEQIQHAINERRHILEAEMRSLSELSDIYGEPKLNGHTNGHQSKTDKFKHILSNMMKERKAWHITEIEQHFKDQNLEWNKGIVHQCIDKLHEDGQLVKIKINESNQKYFYLSPSGIENGRIKESYLPMASQYIESLEVK